MKRRWQDLAIFGGEPLFREPLHVGRPNIGDKKDLLRRFEEILDSRWLTNDGPVVKEFETEVAKMVGVAHAVATCNATLALQLLSRAVGLRGEVIMPAFTFIATAHALRWEGVTPVFCDIDPATHNIDAGQVERLVTERTTGIVGVHLWGRPCDVEALDEIARRHELALVFDAAHAFGCSHQGRMIGGFGLAEVFSFHATKFCHSFEGGAVTTDSQELASRLRLLRNFGFTGFDQVSTLGINAKMAEFAAAMGLSSLAGIDELIGVNRRRHARYRRELESMPGIRVLGYDENERCNFQYVVVEVDEAATGVSRDLLQAVLRHENVLARRYFFPGCHRMPPYGRADGAASLPMTDAVAARVMSLPTGTGVSPEDVAKICDLIRFVVHNHEAIATRGRERDTRDAE